MTTATTNLPAALLDILVCGCGGTLLPAAGRLTCTLCGVAVPVADGRPLFTPVPPTIVPSVRKPRGPEAGTVWRRANWRFYEGAARALPQSSIVLDVGAGQGDFRSIFESHRYVAMDVFPYDAVDVVCDVVISSPLRPASVDAIVLSNVLEHVLDGPQLLRRLGDALKPSGRLLICVPFIIKLHQVPHDFVRYTHFALKPMLEAAGFAVDRLEAVYAPHFLARIGGDNLRASLGPAGGISGAAARGLMKGARLLQKAARRIGGIGEPLVRDVADFPADANPYPIGYQIDARRVAR